MESTLPIPVPTMHAVLSDCTSESESPESPTASSAARQQYLDPSEITGRSLFEMDERSNLASTSTIAPATRLFRPRLSHSGMARRPLARFGGPSPPGCNRAQGTIPDRLP